MSTVAADIIKGIEIFVSLMDAEYKPTDLSSAKKPMSIVSSMVYILVATVVPKVYIKGFRCGEVAIDYRSRVGQGKLSVVDAYRTMYELFRKRFAIKKELLGLTTEEVE